MAHNVESMFYFGARPWHGLGVEVFELLTADEALRKAGLDWEVRKEKIFAKVGDRYIHVPDKFATVRSTDNRPLGVVGASYKPVQNVDALNFIDVLTESGEAKYETAGSLQHGRLIWVMAKVPNGSDGVDPIEPYLLCTTSHDGTSPVMVTPTPVRVVCNNTLNIAVKGAKNKFRIRHTTNVEEKIVEAKKALSESLKYFQKTEVYFDRLKGEKFTEEQLREAVLKVFKGTDDEDALSKRQDTSFNRIVDKITDLSLTGLGTNLPGVKGTAWGGYNAIVEFLDHHTKIKGGKGRSADEKLMNSVWFGTVADKTQKAFDVVSEMVKIAA